MMEPAKASPSKRAHTNSPVIGAMGDVMGAACKESRQSEHSRVTNARTKESRVTNARTKESRVANARTNEIWAGQGT